MTICFLDNANAKKFFARCMYTDGHKDCIFPLFSKIEMLTSTLNLHVETDATCADIENMLTTNNVKYKWVNEY